MNESNSSAQKTSICLTISDVDRCVGRPVLSITMGQGSTVEPSADSILDMLSRHRANRLVFTNVTADDTSWIASLLLSDDDNSDARSYFERHSIAVTFVVKAENALGLGDLIRQLQYYPGEVHVVMHADTISDSDLLTAFLTLSMPLGRDLDVVFVGSCRDASESCRALITGVAAAAARGSNVSDITGQLWIANHRTLDHALLTSDYLLRSGVGLSSTKTFLR